MRAKLQVENSKINRIAVFSILLLAAALLQTTVLSGVKIFGQNALFLIPLTIAVGLFNGHRTGLFFGIILGLIVDSTASKVFGLYILILMATGFVAGIVAKTLMVKSLLASFFIYLAVYASLIGVDFLIRLIVISDFASFPGSAMNQIVSACASLFYLPICYFLVRLLHSLFKGETDD